MTNAASKPTEQQLRRRSSAAVRGSEPRWTKAGGLLIGVLIAIATAIGVEGAVVDVVSPTINITSPESGAEVSPVLTLRGTDWVAALPATVRVQIDGGSWHRAAGNSKWSLPLDTEVLAAGDHTVTAEVVDANGAADSASVSIDTTSTPTYTVPSSIPDDCSTPVDAALERWIATVPDNSTIKFAAGGCYQEAGEISLINRSGLVLDGNGATFKANDLGTNNHRCNFRLQSSSNIVMKNMTIIGANPANGPSDNRATIDGVHYEWQHGISIGSSSGVLISRVTIQNVMGDFIEAAEDPRYGIPGAGPSTDVVVSHGAFSISGRMGVGITDAKNMVIEDTSIDAPNLDAVDVELNEDTEFGRDITVTDNTFRRVQHAMISNAGAGESPNVGAISVTNNVMVGPLTIGIQSCVPPITLQSPAGKYRDGYTITGNQLIAFGKVVALKGINNATISNNTLNQYPRGCSNPTGVSITDSHTVFIGGNNFTGKPSLYTVDSLSSGVTASDNTPAS